MNLIQQIWMINIQSDIGIESIYFGIYNIKGTTILSSVNQILQKKYKKRFFIFNSHINNDRMNNISPTEVSFVNTEIILFLSPIQ